ncbi:Rap1a/Tai family immunity protein [Bradyrhizobium sp. S3.2.12]|uniref:Rap1a/Tai family immunity protein n=1 Tax=Bradyrhizobium sp. S3.2.12 TaxID=3156387 RepID=UPI003391BEE8
MLPHCKALIEDKPPGVWEGQCGGTIDTLVWVGSSLPKRGRFCAPKGIPHMQAHRVVVSWLERHPERLHLSFQGLVMEALMEAWPCPAE